MCTISIARIMNVPSVSLSTASSVDVQGVCISSHLMTDSPASVQSGTGMNKNADPETNAWPKINLFLSISSLPFLFSELSPFSDTSSASASCFILLYLSHLTLSRPFSLFFISKYIPFPRVRLTS